MNLLFRFCVQNAVLTARKRIEHALRACCRVQVRKVRRACPAQVRKDLAQQVGGIAAVCRPESALALPFCIGTGDKLEEPALREVQEQGKSAYFFVF